MFLAAHRFRAIVASGAVTVTLLVVGWPLLAAEGDAPWQAPWAALDDASRARRAWLRQPEAWHLHWSRPLAAGVTVPAAGLLAWLDNRAVHGIRAVDGSPAWRRVPAGDTLLFPRSALRRDTGDRRTAPVPAAICSVGHLLYAMIDAGPLGPLMVCLDCSDTAEGRLLWSASPPAGFAGFDGPPAADDRLCVVVVRRDDVRGSLEIVAHDARDGVVMWRRPLSTGVARDGIDHACGRRQALLVEGFVVLADHAGSVWAFDREGRPAWRYEYAAASRAGDRPRDGNGWLALAEPVVVGPDCLLLAAQDRGGVMALDPAARSAQLRWEAAVGERMRIVGTADEWVVGECVDAGREGGLVTRDVASGHAVASSLEEPSSAGPAVFAAGVVLQPVSAEQVAGQPCAIAVIDPSSLQVLGPPFPIPGTEGGVNAVEGARPRPVYLATMPGALVVATANQLSSIGPAP